MRSVATVWGRATEFVTTERHGALAVGTVAAIVLVAERDTCLIERDQPTVRDRDAMGAPPAAREVRLGVDDPPFLAERHQAAEEDSLVTQANLVTDEPESTRCVQLPDLALEAPPEQLAEHANRQLPDTNQSAQAT